MKFAFENINPVVTYPYLKMTMLPSQATNLAWRHLGDVAQACESDFPSSHLHSDVPEEKCSAFI